MENIIHTILCAAVVAIGLSESIAGYALRSAIVMPFVWADIMTVESAWQFVGMGMA